MAWVAILQALWIFLPAYLANMSPVFMAKLVPRWTAPIDGGRIAKDGKRVLGPGKTWRGLTGGAIVGALAALAVAAGAQAWGVMDGWDYGAYAHHPNLPLGAEPADCIAGEACRDAKVVETPMWAVALFGGLLGFMALVGDAVKSYFKRRTGRDRGKPWVPFDQLDFVVFGVATMFLAAPLLADGWVHAALLDDWLVLTTLFVLTPLLHFLVNVIGYVLRLKEVPW